MPFCHERHKHSDELGYEQIEEFDLKLNEMDQHSGSEEFKNKPLERRALPNASVSLSSEPPRRKKWWMTRRVAPTDRPTSK